MAWEEVGDIRIHVSCFCPRSRGWGRGGGLMRALKCDGRIRKKGGGDGGEKAESGATGKRASKEGGEGPLIDAQGGVQRTFLG